MKKTAEETSRWFQERMDRLGLSQTTLSEKSKIVRPDISRYKNRKQVPRITQLDRLAEALDCNVMELLIGLGAIDPDHPTTPKFSKGLRKGK